VDVGVVTTGATGHAVDCVHGRVASTATDGLVGNMLPVHSLNEAMPMYGVLLGSRLLTGEVYGVIVYPSPSTQGDGV
jgi:hypothetical protein